MNLNNKVILITGSTRGIGRELAIQCLRQGAHVIIHGKDPARLQAMKKKLSAISTHVDGVCADISILLHINKLAKYISTTYKKIDIFVNNAAISMRGSFEECSSALLRTIITTNLTSTLLMTQAITPLLNVHGTILFVSSAAGLYGFPYVIPYSVTKMALNAFCQGLDLEMHDRKIHISTVYLDFVQNDAEKTILNEKNVRIHVKRKARITQEYAAHAIISAIVHHHRVRYVGMGAKLIALMTRYFPHMFHRILLIKKHAIHAHTSTRTTAK